MESRSEPTPGRSATADAVVRIDIDGHTLSGEDLPDWLSRGVKARRRAVRTRHYGYVVERTAEQLVGSGITRANGGLRRAIDYLAQEQGTEIDWRQFGAPLLDLSDPILSSLDGHQPTPHFVNAVRYNERLLAYYNPRFVKLAALVAELAQSYPDANAAVVVVSNSKRYEIAKGLRCRGVEFCVSDGDTQPESGSRVVLCSAQGAAHADVELNHRHLVIFPQALDAISTRCQDILRTATARFRVIGFVPYGAVTSPYEQDLVAGVYGFEQVFVPLHGYDETPVRIAWLPFRAAEVSVDAVASRISTILRRGVWRHDRRNQLIARVARALHHHPSAAELTARFPDLPHELGDISPAQVIVVTGTLVHAAELARWLRNWAIIADPAIQSEGLSSEQQSRLARSSRRSAFVLPPNVIATLAGLRQLRPAGNEILIWAGGGRSAPLLPGNWLVRPSGDSRQLTVIDLRDHHHPRLREWSAQRRRAYRSAEWLDVGTDSLTHRVRRFVSQRGRR